MLQQTQVARVLERWPTFVAHFPTPRRLADARLGDVLRSWDGLGYPRRARHLQLAARAIVEHHDGEVPAEVDDLLALPGVGPYTARAVASFAFGAPVGVLDTNVGRVLSRAVVNATLTRRVAQSLADQLVSEGDSATINQALLDIGSRFCRASPTCEQCPLRRSCRWRNQGGNDPSIASAAVSRPQARYEGSDRQARGRLLRALGNGDLEVTSALRAIDPADLPRARRLLRQLVTDGLVSRRGRLVRLGDR
jgi:A/G-specific adenine glycosylase